MFFRLYSFPLYQCWLKCKYLKWIFRGSLFLSFIAMIGFQCSTRSEIGAWASLHKLHRIDAEALMALLTADIDVPEDRSMMLTNYVEVRLRCV